MLAEQQYLDALQRIYEEGVDRPTRQVGADGRYLTARTITGVQLRFLAEEGMPLTTLRDMRGAFYLFIGELLWILSGRTDLEGLHAYGVRYWDEWGAKERSGWYNLPEGELGPIYGAQWRRFQVGGGVVIDQLARLFRLLADRPDDRSLVVTSWHPHDVDRVVVKPCHGVPWQVLKMGDRLDMLVSQRSADMPIGVPSNLVMYRFLQMLICMKAGYRVGDLVWQGSDVHYYSDQCAGVEELLRRAPRRYPVVVIDPILMTAVDRMLEGDRDPLSHPSINPKNISYNTLLRRLVHLVGYDPHPAIPKNLLPVAI